jgi:hypothetical protein
MEDGRIAANPKRAVHLLETKTTGKSIERLTQQPVGCSNPWG